MNEAGPLEGLRVVELASELGAWAGKLMADLGADVVLVEPPGGDRRRDYPPFLDDEPGRERSLWWWHYHTSKRGITLDLGARDGRTLFERLAAGADLVLEAEPPGSLAERGLDVDAWLEQHPRTIWISVTPFGPDGPRAGELATDLTLLSGGGPAWSCGYDDHALPPVRGGGNQGYHTASHFAVMSALVAVLAREQTGRGQRIAVNAHAAQNVTTEAATYEWLVAGGTVQRQTGRHAATRPTLETQIRCADGRHVNTGVPPIRPRHFRIVLDWIRELDLEGDFPEAFLLELGAERKWIDLSTLAEDEELQAIFGAGREAQNLIASRLSAHAFFVGSQERGLPVGIVYSPDELFDDPHFQARGFQAELEHPDLGRTFTYPGAPLRFEKSPWRLTRPAPRLGEHNAEILGPLAE